MSFSGYRLFPGKEGASGTPGRAFTIDYVFSTTTTDSDPGAGLLRLSNATQNASTVMRVDLIDSNGVDVTAMLDVLDDSTSAIKGHVAISKVDDPTKWLVASLSAMASPSGYRNLTITVVAASTTNPFSNGDALLFDFTRTGDKGADGAAGATGATGATGGSTGSHPAQGRLTLTTGVPVLTSTVSGATTVYYSPYSGNLVPIYDGSDFVVTAFTELSQATTDNTKSPAAAANNSNYDIFVWNDSGTIRATRGPAWTSDTGRGTGAGTTELERVKGVWLNKVSITNGPAANRGTYVGTIRSDGSAQINFHLGGSASGGTAAVLGVWNMYNRVVVGPAVIDSGSGYTYTSSTIRQARNSAGNKISFVIGISEDSIVATHSGRTTTVNVASAFGSIGIGLDSTTTHTVQPAFVYSQAATIMTGTPSTNYVFLPTIGWHFVAALEAGDNTNANTFDDGSLNRLSAAIRM